MALRLKELEQELEQSLQGEAGVHQAVREEKELQTQVQQLQQQKEQLEAQIRQSAAQELGGRYLKAQNLQVRIERLQKEQERCAPYARMDLTQVEQALHRLGARAADQPDVGKIPPGHLGGGKADRGAGNPLPHTGSFRCAGGGSGTI